MNMSIWKIGLQVKRHIAEEITLLCDHQSSVRKLMDYYRRRLLEKLMKDPFNLRQGVSKPYLLHFSG